MVKLISFLTLTLTLCSIVVGLQCWYGHGDPSVQHTCSSSTTELCGIKAAQGYVNGNYVEKINRSCVSRSECKLSGKVSSYNIGFVSLAVSLHCCSEDGCNKDTLTFQEKNNSLQCFTCTDPQSPVCNKTVQCVGNQDSCVNGTVSVAGRSYKTSGCASSRIRKDDIKLGFDVGTDFDLDFVDELDFCGTCFCNSATINPFRILTCGVSSSRLGLITLLFMLFTFVAC